MCAFTFIHTRKKGQTSGVCCQDIIKTKSQPPLGMTEFDQSKALFQVRITFQLLTLMNSLYWLMKSSAANEVDSVFVLFTAHFKHNIVTVLPYKVAHQRAVKKREMILQSPVNDNQCSRIFWITVLLQWWEMSCVEEYRKSLSHLLCTVAVPRSCQPATPAVHLAILLMCNKIQL